MTVLYHMGVDGGGTGTRLRLRSVDGRRLGDGCAGPSALGQGVSQAWKHIQDAAAAAVVDAVSQGNLLSSSQFNEGFIRNTRIGMGLSGAENPAWVAEFARRSPPWAERLLVNDGVTAVLGAHGGREGLVVSVGTGCIGVALQSNGRMSVIGGWGWQLGDEGSGAWLGRQAVAHLQHAMDGREPAGPLAKAVGVRCGQDRASVLDWCARAGQAEFSALAPLVFAMEESDPRARALIYTAVRSVEEVVKALDPQEQLPLVLSGSIGQRLSQRVNDSMMQRLVEPQSDACEGALRLLDRPWQFLNDKSFLHQDMAA